MAAGVVDQIGAVYLPLFFCFAIVFYALRYRGRKKKGFYPKYSDAGNALQQLQQLFQPRHEYVLREKRKDDVVQDGEAGPKDPTAGLKRH